MICTNDAKFGKTLLSFISAWRFCFSRIEPLWLNKLFRLHGCESGVNVNSSIIWLPFFALILGSIPGIFAGMFFPVLNKFGVDLVYVASAMIILEWYDCMTGTRMLANCCVVFAGKMFNRQYKISEVSSKSIGLLAVVGVLAFKVVMLIFCCVTGRFLWLVVVFSAMLIFKSETSPEILKRNKQLLRILFIILAGIFSIFGSFFPLLLSVAVFYGLFLQYGKIIGNNNCDDDEKITVLFIAILEIVVLLFGAIFIKL